MFYVLGAAALLAVVAAIGLVDAHRCVGFLLEQNQEQGSGTRTRFRD
jgi:hypothetical protein